MGLSYQKIRRLLNGCVSRGTPYFGLLEKCPAISLYDATVTEDGGCGVTVRRREQYFTFDNEVYRPGAVRPPSSWTTTPTMAATAADFSRMAAVAANVLPPVNPADYIALPVAKDEPGPASAAGGRRRR